MSNKNKQETSWETLQQVKENLRNDLLGSERIEDDITRKLESAEKLLAIQENEYAKKRAEFLSIQNVWFSTKTVMITIGVFIATFLGIALFASANIISTTDVPFFGSLQFSFIAALGSALISLIISIAINNVRLQQKNAEISIIYSEIMSLRSRITLLQEKSLGEKIDTPQDKSISSDLETRGGFINLLKGGKIKDFNEARERFNFAALDLREEDLRGSRELQEIDLRNVNLENAIFEPLVNLYRSNLSEANLSRAKLKDALLGEVNLTNANLRLSYLEHAMFNRATLAKTDLSSANLRGAVLIDAKLLQANLSGANLSEAQLQYAIILGCSYHDVRCEDADFSNAVIDSNNFVEYLKRNGARNVPSAESNYEELKRKLQSNHYAGVIREYAIEELLNYSFLK